MPAQLNVSATVSVRDYAQRRIDEIEKAKDDFRGCVNAMIELARVLGVNRNDRISFEHSIDDALSDLFFDLDREYRGEIDQANRDLNGRD